VRSWEKVNIGVNVGIRYLDYEIRQLAVDTDYTDEVGREISKGDFDELIIRGVGYEAMEQLIDEGLDLKRLAIHWNISQDVSWVSKCVNLEYLSIRSKVRGSIDFSQLTKLKEAEVAWCPATRGLIVASAPLKALHITGFKGELEGWSDTIKSTVATLSFTGSLLTLNGIGKFKRLKSLGLLRLRKLENIDEISHCLRLESLNLCGCNQVASLEALTDLKNLRTIDFTNKSLPSVALFPKISLETLSLGDDTIVEDGNTGAFLEFPKLRRVVFTPRKLYTHTPTEINKVLESRNSD